MVGGAIAFIKTQEIYDYHVLRQEYFESQKVSWDRDVYDLTWKRKRMCEPFREAVDCKYDMQMPVGGVLLPGESLCNSLDGTRLTVTALGYLSVVRDNKEVWNSGLGNQTIKANQWARPIAAQAQGPAGVGKITVFQTDCNLVTYDAKKADAREPLPGAKPVWSSNTAREPDAGCRVFMGAFNLKIYRTGDHAVSPIFSTGYNGGYQLPRRFYYRKGRKVYVEF